MRERLKVQPLRCVQPFPAFAGTMASADFWKLSRLSQGGLSASTDRLPDLPG